MSLNKLIQEVSNLQLNNLNNNNTDTLNIEIGNTDNKVYKGIDTRKTNSAVINAIFSNGDINIADVDTRYADAVNLHVVKNWKVAQIGAGGIGSPVVQTLVGMGITDYTLFDDDVVEVHNCGPQMHPITNIGKPKVQSTAEQMYAFRGIHIHERKERVKKLQDLYNNNKIYDVIINSVDNMDIRRTLGWELLSPVFEEYKGYKLLVPEVVDNGYAYNIENSMPIEYAIPTLLNDLHNIIKHVKDTLHVKNSHEYLYINIKELQLNNITINMFKYINSVVNPFTGSTSHHHEINNIYQGICNDNININPFTYVAEKYFNPPYIHNDNMCISMHTLLMLLLTIDMYFLHSQMYATVHTGIYTNKVLNMDTVKSIENPSYNTIYIDNKNKYMVLPIYPVIRPDNVDDYLTNIVKLTNYVTQYIPEVYVDSRMSLGTWNTYTLLLKDAMYQSIYLYWHVIGCDYTGTEYLELNKRLPIEFSKVLNIGTLTESDLNDIKQVMYTPDKWGIMHAMDAGSIIGSEYITNMLFSKVSSSMCLCEFLTEALFDGSEAIQEPCTARAIVYTGVNIASYIGAILHYISSRPYAAGDIRYFIKSYMNTDNGKNVFSPEKVFSQNITNNNSPFRWRHTFNSRSFLSNSDVALEKTIEYMNSYRNKYTKVNASLDKYMHNIKDDILAIFEKQNVLVLDYIGAVLHKVTENYTYADTCNLLNIHKNTSNNKYTANSNLIPDNIHLNDTRIGYLYTIWLLWLSSAGYIDLNELTIDSDISDKVPYLTDTELNSTYIKELLVNRLSDVDSNLWDTLFKEDNNIGNSLLTIMASYREMLANKCMVDTIMEKDIDVASIYKIFTSIVNKHILQIILDSNAIGLSNLIPSMYRNSNIDRIIKDISDSDNSENRLDNINNTINRLKGDNISISDALMLPNMSLNYLYHGHKTAQKQAEFTAVGIITDNSLLKVFKEHSVGVLAKDNFLNRVHYPVQFICNIIHKNTLNKLGRELDKQKINLATKGLLNLQQGDLSKYGNIYVDDISLLYSSNSLKFNGSNLVLQTDEYTFVILTENSIRVPMSFNNYNNYEYGSVNNVYTHNIYNNDIAENVDIPKEILNNIYNNNLLKNAYAYQFTAALDKNNTIISEGDDFLNIEKDTIYSNFKDINIRFPLSNDTYIIKDNKYKGVLNVHEQRIPTVYMDEQIETIIKMNSTLEQVILSSIIYQNIEYRKISSASLRIITDKNKKYLKVMQVNSTDDSVTELGKINMPKWYQEYYDNIERRIENADEYEGDDSQYYYSTPEDVIRQEAINKQPNMTAYTDFYQILLKGALHTSETVEGYPRMDTINAYNESHKTTTSDITPILIFTDELNNPSVRIPYKVSLTIENEDEDEDEYEDDDE